MIGVFKSKDGFNVSFKDINHKEKLIIKKFDDYDLACDFKEYLDMSYHFGYEDGFIDGENSNEGF